MKKIRYWLWLCPALAAVLLWWLLPHCPWVAEYVFARGIYRVLNAVIGWVVALLPFSLTELSAVLAIPFAAVFTVWLIRRFRRQDCAARWRTGRRIGAVMSAVLLLYMLMHGAQFYRVPLGEQMEIKTSDDPAVLERVCVWLAQQASAAREEVAEDENGCMQLSQSAYLTLCEADAGYDALRERWPFLQTAVWRAKPVMLSHPWSYTGITGMYFPMYAEANVNIDVPHSQLPFNAAHEIGHTCGFAREDECNFLAFLSCIHSPSADYRYAGYLNGYVHCSNALYAVDRERWQAVSAYCSEAVRRDLQQQRDYWKSFEGPIRDISTSVNDSFLTSQGQTQGVRSYGMVTELILGWYLTENPEN